MRTLQPLLLLLGLLLYGHTAFAAGTPNPANEGVYAGVVKSISFDLGDGSKVKSTEDLMIEVKAGTLVEVTYGLETRAQANCAISPKNGGFYYGQTDSLNFTILFEFKGKKGMKGTLHFISPYRATSGKFSLRKVPIASKISPRQLPPS